MGLVSQFRSGIRAAFPTFPGPLDNWSPTGGPVGYGTGGGAPITPELALQHATVYTCRRIVAETLAFCPCIIYERLPDGGRRRAIEHPVYSVLHDRPNAWQTPFEFIEMMQGHVELRGNSYAFIIPGPRGPIDSLIPIHPDRVTIQRLDNGRLLYEVKNWKTGITDKYPQAEIFHLRGLSTDGFTGVSTITASSQVFAKGIEQQNYATRFLRNDSTPGGVIKHPGHLKTDAYNKFKTSWEEYQSGRNRGKTAILEDGMEYQAIGITNKDSQLLEASMATREEICGMFRVPPHKAGILQRSTNNNIEHQAIEFISDCMAPRAARFEQRLDVDLITPLNEVYGREYYAEFLLDALQRGDFKSRMEGHAIARQNGLRSANDVCKLENWNPIDPEDGGDDYWRPSNMVVAGDPLPQPVTTGPLPSDRQPSNPPPDQNANDESSAHEERQQTVRISL